MKPASAKRIIDAYAQVFEQLSLKTFKLGFAVVVDSFEKRMNALRQVRSPEGLQAMLLKEPEPAPFALDAQIKMIQLLPYTLRRVMPEAMKEFSRALPHDPGGRPSVLTDEESAFVCEEIGKLFAKGVRLLNGQKRLAQRMTQKKGKKISLRTIQRAWRGRARLQTGSESESEESKE